MCISRSHPAGLHCIKGRQSLSFYFSSVQLLSSVRFSMTTWTAHVRPPCPSPTPRVYSNSFQLLATNCHFECIHAVKVSGKKNIFFIFITNAKPGNGEGGGGVGIRMGTHVNPWLIHVNVWQKPLQYFKVISLQLIKIKKKTGKVIKITE